MTTPVITNTSANFARGVNKILTIAPESAFGVPPSAGSVPGQVLRRNTAVFNLTQQLISSQEINPSQQTRDAQPGPRSVSGTLSGNLSPATYSLIWEALLRNNFTLGVSVTNITDTTGALSGTNLLVTSVATNFQTAGFTQGDVVAITGLTGAGAADNGDNFRIVGFSGGGNGIILSEPTASGAAVGWTTGQTITVKVTGKKLLLPVTGQITPSFTIEEWFSDIGQSRLSSGLRVTQASFNIPASGFVTFSASFSGQNQVVGTSQVYASPAAETTTTGLTAVGGAVYYKGVQVAYLNSMSLQVASQTQANPVVGSNIVPDVLLGKITAQGSFSCLLTLDSMQADYLNGLEVELSLLLTSSGAANATFFSIYLPRCKLSSATVNDSDQGITRSFNFMALENIDNANAPDTTIVIQDALA